MASSRTKLWKIIENSENWFGNLLKAKVDIFYELS